MKVFISHSSRDKEIGKLIVNLLKEIGVKNTEIVFTSREGYGIPKGENIYDWLKAQLKEKPYVIYLLSNNYYSSVACLNEMGAAWMIESQHIFFFAPNFDLSNYNFSNGAIDPRKMGVHVNNKNELSSFCEEFVKIHSIETKITFINQAIHDFMKGIENLPKQESLKQIRLNNSKQMVVQVSDENVEKENSIFDLLLNEKLSDEEVLTIAYLKHLGKVNLLYGWQKDNEINEIREWEDIIGIRPIISKNYDRVISRLKIRKIIEPSAFTEQSNIKEYSLLEKFHSIILELPEVIQNNVNVVIERNKIEEELDF